MIEPTGVMDIYRRSISKHNLRYMKFIGDGDSASYSQVEKSMPYGPLYIPEKKECVNHITKRMGTGLRALLRDYKGETHLREW